MKTIFRDNADRISVADAKRLILEALPPERSAEVYARVDENGDIDFEGPLELREVHGVQIYASFIDRDFLPICEQLSIQPRMRYRPAFTNYAWKSSEDDALYTIAHDEFSRVTELFGLTVAIGQAPEPQAAPVLPAGASDGTEHDKSDKLRQRPHQIAHLIVEAQRRCTDPSQINAVFEQLMGMATEGKWPMLIGITDGGIQYTDTDNNGKEFSKKQLAAYLRGDNLTRKRPHKSA